MMPAPEFMQPDGSGAIRLLVDPQSLSICDADGRGLALLGYPREALLGRPVTDLEVSLADAAYWDEVRACGAARSHVAEGAYRCADGELLAVAKSVAPAERDGRTWLLVRADPLARGPRVEDELAATASLLQATLEATADGILLVDRAGAIVNMNRKFAQLWDLPADTLAAREDAAVFAHMAGQFSEPQAYRAGMAGISPQDEGETFDLLHLADGRLFERKSMPVRRGTRVLGRVFSYTDITTRKRMELARAQLEAQLRESQKMEAIGTLAGGIAHDFNNIIATILGNAELARQDAGGNRAVQESLEEIRKAGSRARDLVQQILSFSRRQPTERKRLALAPVVAEAARLLRATLPARVALEVECDADLPAVLADATQIQQVLINLATNAMQAMHGRPGRIAMRLDSLMLDAALAATHPALHALHVQHPGRVLRLEVSDDGPGMEAAVLERIFEPFFTTKPVNEGTGLGLSVVHGIVRAHEGAIVVRSLPAARLTTFTIYLPGAAASSEAAPAGEAPSAPAGHAQPDPARGPRILYLDDDESLVFLVTRVLERGGFRVSAHTSQREALAALGAAPDSFDLVVTDYNMPGMSGLDVARRVRALRADLPVAVASGFIDEALSANAEGAGVRELIFKASTVEGFCAVVQRLAHEVTAAGGSS